MISLTKLPMPHTSESSAIVFNNRFERRMALMHVAETEQHLRELGATLSACSDEAKFKARPHMKALTCKLRRFADNALRCG